MTVIKSNSKQISESHKNLPKKAINRHNFLFAGSVQNIFEESKGLLIRNLELLRRRFSKRSPTIQSTNHFTAAENQNECGPLELRGRTLLNKFSDVMNTKHISLITETKKVESSRSKAQQAKLDAALIPGPTEVMLGSSILDNNIIKKQLSESITNKELKPSNEEYASAEVKSTMDNISIASNSSSSNPFKAQRPVMFSAFDLQAVNLKKKSITADESMKIPDKTSLSTVTTSNDANCSNSNKIPDKSKKSFNINDILNVKLRSRKNELDDSSKSIITSDHPKKSSEAAKVAIKRKTPILPKTLGSINNSQISMHSALKQALAKKFKTAARQSINPEAESPNSQW